MKISYLWAGNNSISTKNTGIASVSCWKMVEQKCQCKNELLKSGQMKLPVCVLKAHNWYFH